MNTQFIRKTLYAVIFQLPLFYASAHATDTNKTTPVKEANIQFQQEQVLPNVALDGDILFRLVLSEMAGLQGQVGSAYFGYLKLAEETRDPRIARQATRYASYMRQPDKILSAARLWAATAPNSAEAMQTLVGTLASVQGNLDEIEKPLARLLAREGNEATKLLVQLNRLFERYTKKQEIARLIERLTQPYNKFPEAHLCKAIAWLSANDLKKSIDEANIALKQRPDWESAALVRAQALAQDKRTVAMEELRTFGERYPKSRDVRLTYARWLASERRNDELRAYYGRLLKDFSDDEDLAYNVAALAVSAGDSTTAENQLRHLISTNYRDPDVLRFQLAELLPDNRWQEALKLYESVGEGKTFAPAQIRAASVRAKNGQIDLARKTLQSLASKDQDDSNAYVIAEAQILRDAGQVQEGLQILESALQAQPAQTELLYESAMLAERLDKLDLVEVNLRKLITLRPDYAHAYNALGYAWIERNIRLDEAAQLIQKAVELDPKDPFILDSMGWLLYRQGNMTGALAHLQQAFSLKADPEIAAHLGEILWAVGRQDEARTTLESARKDNPDNTSLANVIKRLIH